MGTQNDLTLEEVDNAAALINETLSDPLYLLLALEIFIFNESFKDEEKLVVIIGKDNTE